MVMNEKIVELNHHVATVLPYYVDSGGTTWFVFERKSHEFRDPYFNDALNFIGGNWFPDGCYNDLSPEETLYRVINGEFGDSSFGRDGLDVVLHDSSYDAEPKTKESCPKEIQNIGTILLKNFEYLKTYQVFVDKPEISENLVYGSSIFCKKLSKEEFNEINSIIQEKNGEITMDNVRKGSKLEIISLENIENERFAWGYDRIMNDLIGNKKKRIVEKMNLEDNIVVNVMSDIIPGIIESTLRLCPTYKGIQSAGYLYKK